MLGCVVVAVVAVVAEICRWQFFRRGKSSKFERSCRPPVDRFRKMTIFVEKKMENQTVIENDARKREARRSRSKHAKTWFLADSHSHLTSRPSVVGSMLCDAGTALVDAKTHKDVHGNHPRSNTLSRKRWTTTTTAKTQTGSPPAGPWIHFPVKTNTPMISSSRWMLLHQTVRLTGGHGARHMNKKGTTGFINQPGAQCRKPRKPGSQYPCLPRFLLVCSPLFQFHPTRI